MSRFIQKWLTKSLMSLQPKLPWLATQMAGADFSQVDKSDYLEDGFAYEKAVVLSSFLDRKMVKWDTKDTDFAQQDIDAALSELRRFSELRAFLLRCRHVQKMTEYLSIKLGMDIATSNFTNTKEVG